MQINFYENTDKYINITKEFLNNRGLDINKLCNSSFIYIEDFDFKFYDLNKNDILVPINLTYNNLEIKFQIWTKTNKKNHKEIDTILNYYFNNFANI